MIAQLQSQERMIKDLIKKVKDFESIEEERDHYSSKLNKLYEVGLIDKEGNLAGEEEEVKSQEEEEIRF